MKLKKTLAIVLAALLVLGLPLGVLADIWDIGNGSVTVEAKEDGQWVSQNETTKQDDAPTITGTTTDNTLTIKADAGQTADVTLSDLDINVWNEDEDWHTGNTKAGISTEGEGNVTITVNGENQISGGNGHAGVEKQNEGNLTITGSENDSLTANGGIGGAGIGGGLAYIPDPDSDLDLDELEKEILEFEKGDNITISGGNITANGGAYGGAGIGGASGIGGSGTNIKITGGNVIAVGGNAGAGIGGGMHGDAKDILITGGTVNASSSGGGAGIGSGQGGDASNITISGGNVTADGTSDMGTGGAGIGSGSESMKSEKNCDASNITISGGTVNATGGAWAAGIGGGGGNGSNITISGGDVTATGGAGGACIGGGFQHAGSNITISGDADVKIISREGGGAYIGDGAQWPNGVLEKGKEVAPNIARLSPNGSIKFYSPGADPDKDEPIKTIVGTFVPPAGAPDTRYYLTDENETALSSRANVTDGVMTVNTEESTVKCYVTREGLQKMASEGITVFRVVTPQGSFEVTIADLLAKTGESFCFVISDGAAVLLMDGSQDVSELLH